MKLKKLTTAILAVILSFAMMIPVFAASAADTGTITVNHVTEKDTYDIYRVFDLTYKGTKPDVKVSYTINADWAGFFTNGAGKDYIVDANDATANDNKGLNPITIDGATKYINIVETNKIAFVNAAVEYAVKNSVPAVDTKVAVADSDKVVFENLPYGYYLVHPRNVSVVDPTNDVNGAAIGSINSTVPDMEVNVKPNAPTLTKSIVENDKDVTSNNAGIGGTVNFKLETKAPSMVGYEKASKYTFVIKDTMPAGLTFNNDVKITVGGKEIANPADYTVDSTANPFVITFVDFYNLVKDQTNASIVVTYSATVNEQATVGNTPNVNSAVLTYSSDPKGDVTQSVTSTTKVETNTYVTAITIAKVDSSDKTALAGAKFKITGANGCYIVSGTDVFVPATALKDATNATKYTQATDGTFAEAADGAYVKLSAVDKDTLASTKFDVESWVDANGNITFKGLPAGEYTIEELEAPEGYNKLTGPITVKITETNGVFTYDVAGTGAGTTLDDGTLQITVENSSGFLLPNTGGIGTTVFYVVGGVLMAGAVILLAFKKKSANGEA